MKTMKRSMMATIAAVALPLGLAACSDSSEEDTDTTQTETADGGEDTTDGGEDTTDGGEDTTDGGEDTTDGGDSAGGRPSKEEYRQGMEELLNSMGYTEEKYAEAGVTAEQIDAYYNCIVEDSYDNLSDGFIQGVANADASAPTEAGDMEAFQASIELCVQEIGGGSAPQG